MMNMMNGGMGMPMMGDMFLSMILWILLLAVLIWALMTWINRQWSRPQPVLHTPYPSHSYEQGDRPAQPLPGSDWEDDRSRQLEQQYEQPSASYPFEQQMPPQL